MNQTIVFQKRFEKQVESGKKRQTIRPDSAFRQKLKVGSIVYLRGWKGLPYHSKQKQLGEGVVTVTFSIIWTGSIFLISSIVNKNQNPTRMETMDFWRDIAKRDGFKNLNEMVAWFLMNHPRRNVMRVIRWELG